MRALSLVCAGAWALAGSAPGSALALECFQQLVAPAPVAADPAARGSRNLPVTLATTFRTVPGCLYGTTPDLVRAQSVPAGETDFATLAARLDPDAHGEAPRSLYARPQGAGGALESVFRAQCTTTLLGPDAVFDLRTATATRFPVVQRNTPPACAAERLELRFLPAPAGGAVRPSFSAEVGSTVLAVNRPSVTVETTGDFLVYAARATTGGRPSVGMLVGTVRPGDPLTPLRRAFAGTTEAPWLRADWGDDGALSLHQAAGLSDDAWAEFATAASADALWLTDIPRPDNPGAAPKVHGSVRLLGDEGRGGVAVPLRLVSEMMRRRYGPASAAMVPTLTEWQGLLHQLQVCLAPSYAAAHAPPPERLPPAARCARLANVMAALSLPEAVASPLPQQLCIQRGTWRLRAGAPEAAATLPPVCLPLARVPASAEERPGATEIVTVGDRLAVSGDATGLYACIDNTCRVLHADEGEAGLTAWRGGLLEVRRARSLDAALSSEGVTLVRAVVVDPGRDWLPLGLVQTPRPPGSPDRPWSSLVHDEPAVFAFVRRVSHLSFGLTLSPAAAAAWNVPGAPTLLGAEIPVAGGFQGAAGPPPSSALVALVRADAQCPTQPAGQARRALGVDPNALLPDQEFTVFLARYRDDETPFECLAAARFRVRARRTRQVLRAAPWLHLGLLGDVQWAFFLRTPFATGPMIPVGYAAARLPFGFRAEAAVNLTAGVTFDDAALTRAGVGVSLSVGWGPRALPRIVSVGAMLHLADGTRDDEPLVSPYAALNLGALVDLVGGR